MARYARISVEVNLSKPLLGKYLIDDRTFYVEYESLDRICFACVLYGHKVYECPSRPTLPITQNRVLLRLYLQKAWKQKAQ
ncbi:hypothetical protein LINPERPRIM_LOCUS40793 [Linum perenne]